ncbi:uncharacterized protein LOC127257103 [Andrographis paniculata]|uniref:uncharacterized protein LOC127257103 n=1 Tax=Andrographis paniculata TaxID=175694 RepID=UPI0021E797AD|nr:uncharacterized protein LOC127257103 [Andrographis paniculata]
MGRCKSRNEAPDREKNWNKIFTALVKLSQNLQRDRQFLEERIKSLNEVIYKMKMEQKVNSSKGELMFALKDREAFIYHLRYENSENDLADFREWFEYLSEKHLEPNIESNDVCDEGENRALKNEVRKLKSEFDEYRLEKETEISALKSEKSFIQNQSVKMERDFSDRLRKKNDQVEKVNEKMKILVDKEESLESSNQELRAELGKKETESVQKGEEILRLLKEIEHLKSRLGSSSYTVDDNKIVAMDHHRTQLERKSFSPMRSHIKPTARKSTGGKAPARRLFTKGSSRSSKKIKK